MIYNMRACMPASHQLVRAGSGAEQFPKVSGGGLSKESPAMFRLFYNDGDCLRLPEHQPCPDSAWRFFQVCAPPCR